MEMLRHDRTIVFALSHAPHKANISLVDLI